MAVTTFDIFKQLLQNSVNNDATLDSATKASMTTRITELAQQVFIDLLFSNVEGSAGSVTVDQAAGSIEVAIGVLGTNQVTWNEMTWQVPRQIRGTVGTDGGVANGGFLMGEIGTSATAVKVPEADITIQYKLGSADPNWKNFDDTTILDGVIAIQFRANIDDQASEAVLQALHVYAEQE